MAQRNVSIVAHIRHRSPSFFRSHCLFVSVVIVQRGHRPWVRNHIRHITSVYVVFCVHMYSFAGLIRRTPPPTFSDTAITDRYSDCTFSSSELTECGYPGLLGRKNRSGTCAAGGTRFFDFLRGRRTPYPLGQALRSFRSQ